MQEMHLFQYKLFVWKKIYAAQVFAVITFFSVFLFVVQQASYFEMAWHSALQKQTLGQFRLQR